MINTSLQTLSTSHDLCYFRPQASTGDESLDDIIDQIAANIFSNFPPEPEMIRFGNHSSIEEPSLISEE